MGSGEGLASHHLAQSHLAQSHLAQSHLAQSHLARSRLAALPLSPPPLRFDNDALHHYAESHAEKLRRIPDRIDGKVMLGKVRARPQTKGRAEVGLG